MKLLKKLILVALSLLCFAAPSPAKKNSVILATTTSTQDSGLLDVLIPIFEKKSGYFVKTIAVGSGQALMMGRRGEADVLLVHSPEEEVKFMKAGYGISRRLVMHNDFVLVGPKADPAKIRGTKNITKAFKQIAERRTIFISRGDNSGTHSAEMLCWKKANISPSGQRWYQETGLGMGQTLGVADEKGAYTLTDRGTFLALKRNLSLEILLEGAEALSNIYHVIELNPEKLPMINYSGGKAFADFIVSKEAQDVIRTFGVEKFGQPLFFPDADKKGGTKN